MLRAIFLGIIQGITEFLPVSSSGHLVLLQQITETDLGSTFDILLHLGTLLATLIYFRKQITKLSKTYIKHIIIASIPAGVVGILLEKHIETLFSTLNIVFIGFIITTILLSIPNKTKNNKKTQLSNNSAIKIGLAQALAIIPGISRSGSTISIALLQGIKQKEAFTFSFLLSIPSILGAILLNITDIQWSTTKTPTYISGLISAAISGYIALHLLSKITINSKLHKFATYTAIMAITTLVIILNK